MSEERKAIIKDIESLIDSNKEKKSINWEIRDSAFNAVLALIKIQEKSISEPSYKKTKLGEINILKRIIKAGGCSELGDLYCQDCPFCHIEHSSHHASLKLAKTKLKELEI